MRFTRKGNCQTHEKRHTEDTKTIKCTFCNAGFEHKFYLNQHLNKKHNAEKPHANSSNPNDEKLIK